MAPPTCEAEQSSKAMDSGDMRCRLLSGVSPGSTEEQSPSTSLAVAVSLLALRLPPIVLRSEVPVTLVGQCRSDFERCSILNIERRTSCCFRD